MFYVFKPELVIVAVICFYFSHSSFSFFQPGIVVVDFGGEYVAADSAFLDDLVDVGQDILFETGYLLPMCVHDEGVVVYLLYDGVVVQLEGGLGCFVGVLDDCAEVAVVDVQLLALLLQLAPQKVAVVLDAAHSALEDGLHLVQLKQKVLDLAQTFLLKSLQPLSSLLDRDEPAAINSQVDCAFLAVGLILGLQLVSCFLLWVIPAAQVCFHMLWLAGLCWLKAVDCYLLLCMLVFCHLDVVAVLVE